RSRSHRRGPRWIRDRKPPACARSGPCRSRRGRSSGRSCRALSFRYRWMPRFVPFPAFWPATLANRRPSRKHALPCKRRRVGLGLEAHDDLAPDVEYRSLDQRREGDHERHRLLLVEGGLLVIGELAEG